MQRKNSPPPSHSYMCCIWADGRNGRHEPIAIMNTTSGYATWFTAGGTIRIAHYDVIDDVITWKLQEIEKNGDDLAPWNLLSYPMVKTSSLYNNFCKTGNYVIYDVIIWVQDGNCKKMARENFSIWCVLQYNQKSGQCDQNCRTR